MSLDRALLWAIAAVLLLALVPTLGLLAREAWQRLASKRALERLAEARAIFAGLSAGSAPAAIAAALSPRFDPTTVERVLEGALRDTDANARQRAAEVCAQLGLTARLSKRARGAKQWSERASAVEILGLMGSPAAVPALVECLRDPYEDEASVKRAAAGALARIREPSVIPLLVAELHTIDAWSSPRVADALVAFGPAATEWLIPLLDDVAHASGAVWAARVLGRTRDPAAIEPLIARLQDPDDAMRIAAAEALGAIGDRRAIQPLTQAALRDPIAQVRAHAAGALGNVGDKASSEVLLGMLADPDIGTRLRVLDALEMIHPEDTSALEGALRDPNPEVRRRAAFAIERVGYLERQVAALESPEPDVTRKAYAAVLELGRAGLIDSLAGYLRHKSATVRAEMARACGELGIGRVGGLLVAAADDPDAGVRQALALAIGKLRVEGGAPALTLLLDDRESAVREQAAEALAAYGREPLAPHYARITAAYERGSTLTRAWIVEIAGRFDRPETRPLLLRAAVDPGEEVRLRAVRALAGAPGADVLDLLVARMTDASGPVCVAAVDALGARDDDGATEAVLRALPGASPEMRDHLARALALAGKMGFGERLTALVATEDLDVRLGLAWTLGKLADPRGVGHLVQYLGDPDSRLRASAAGALGKIQSTEAADALLAATHDPDPRTRAAIVNALGRATTELARVSAALTVSLDDPDHFVRDRAAIALGRLREPAGAEVLASVRDGSQVTPAVLLVARALAGAERGVADASAALLEQVRGGEVRAVLEREDDGVRQEFFRRLHLDVPNGSGADLLEPAAIVAKYRNVLRASQDVRSRRLAVETLARSPSQDGIETLAEVVTSDPSEEVRLLAAVALAGVGSSDVALSALAKAALDPNTQVAVVAVRALGRSRLRAHGDVLFRRLDANDREVGREAIAALAELYRNDPLPLIDHMMGTSRADIVGACVRVLGQWGQPSLLPLLIELVKSQEPSIRGEAVWALAALPLPEANAAVDDARRDAMEPVRLAALEAIASWDPVAPTERLRPMCSDHSAVVRARLAAVLAAIPGPQALEMLIRLADDVSPDVRGTALASLLGRGDTEALTAYAAAFRRATPEALRVLRQDPRAESISHLLSGVVSTALLDTMRETAVTAIGTFAVADFERLILPTLSDPAPRVRLAAVQALSSLDRPAARAALDVVAQDPDAVVRFAAQRALSRRA